MKSCVMLKVEDILKAPNPHWRTLSYCSKSSSLKPKRFQVYLDRKSCEMHSYIFHIIAAFGMMFGIGLKTNLLTTVF